jgi:hypothetical protein
MVAHSLLESIFTGILELSVDLENVLPTSFAYSAAILPIGEDLHAAEGKHVADSPRTMKLTLLLCISPR